MEKYVDKITDTQGDILHELNLEKYILEPIKSMKDYLSKTHEEIKQDGETYTPPQLIKIMTSSFPRETLMEFKNILETQYSNKLSWNKEDLLDILYELEFRLISEFKSDKKLTEIYRKTIYPFLNNIPKIKKLKVNQGTQDEYTQNLRYSIRFNSVATIIDAHTYSTLYYLMEDDNILKNIDLSKTDIQYFKMTKGDSDKDIIPDKPIEVTKDWLDNLLNELTSKNTPESREIKRRLKYHKSRIIIDKLTFKGEKIKLDTKETRFVVMALATGLYKNYNAENYFIKVETSDAFELTGAINTALWELYFQFNNGRQEVIDKIIQDTYKPGTLCVYSLGTINQVRKVIESNRRDSLGNLNDNTNHYDTIDSLSVCRATVEHNDPVSKTIRLRLIYRKGKSQFTDSSTETIKYNEIFSPITNINSDGIITYLLPDKLKYIHKILIPMSYCWDFVHPQTPHRRDILLSKKVMACSDTIYWK